MAKIKKTRFYHDALDQHVGSVVLYADSSTLYFDNGHTQAVPVDQVLDLCLKQLVLVYDTDTYYAVTSVKEAEGTVTVAYGSDKTATATAAKVF